MKALVFNGVEDVTCETVPDAVLLKDTDALVAVRRAAICGSDLHPFFGREEGLDAGTIMGHEFAGEVVDVGSAVTRFKKGDRVACPFTSSCGHCHFCQIGLTCRCIHGRLFGWVEQGKGLHGTQAELVRVPTADGTLMALPDDVDDELGTLLGDILPTGFFAAQGCDIQKGGTYVVVGAGPVGLMALLSARRLGAGDVYVCDLISERLSMAESLGGIPIDVAKEDPVAILKRATNGRGADGAMELVGNEPAGRLAFDILRPGATLSIAGVHTEAHFPFSPVEAYDKNITLRVGRCPARHLMGELLPMARELDTSIRGIISHRLNLLHGRHGYHIFSRKLEGCTKVMLYVG